MSQQSARRNFEYGSQGGGSTINQKAALASAYQGLGKELASNKLKMVGNYTLQRPIGEGTFGKVRLGLHRLTNTRVAIKQIPKAHSASLTREIHHHRRLHHPNVMQLYEVIATEQYIWMVSELCAGGELYDYLVENQVLPEPEARRIFGQLCLAVAYVHSRGIVHRDLKLENILLDERCNVKLGDFGFTREFEAKRLMDTFCGTTGYASPEMLAGKKYTGEQVDIWSLGVILYALLCGALPFDDDDESVMKNKILRGEFEIPDCLSEEARDLIVSILQQDPTKRPSIRAILSHPWFTKMMIQSPMSTVDEDDVVPDYFGTKPAGHSTPASPDHKLDSPTQFIDKDSASLASRLASNSTAIPIDTQPSHHLAASASATSEASYHSTRSDSESSGRRSINTDLTDPTTADSLSRTDEAFHADDLAAPTPDTTIPAEPATPSASTTTSSQPVKNAISLHRNESQSTIRRLGSNGSDASLGAVSKQPTRSTSTSLPTHHELPASNDHTNDLHVPMYQSVPLTKRGSQSSLRGHHRTPSRTKRRSLSSGGLSDHHPPLLGRKPVDYIAQLAELQPATFSTAVEQNLLHQLSTLGIDVGQMVHSIVNDACDASGAMWWMLLRKAKDRQAEQPSFNPAAVETSNTTIDNTPVMPSLPEPRANNDSKLLRDAVLPPPVPSRDPARGSLDQSRPKEGPIPSFTASKSDSAGLSDAAYRRLQTVVSNEQLGVSPSQPLYASASDIAVFGSTTDPQKIPVAALSSASSPAIAGAPASPLTALQHDRSLASTPESSGSPRPKSQHRHTTATASPSKLQQVTNSLVTHSPGSESAKSRRNAQVDRPRSNSLSVKQFAQSVLGTKDKASANPTQAPPEQVIVAGEVLPLERARSPTLFGRRNTVSNVKDSMIGRLSNPSTPKKAAAETPDKPRKSTSKKSAENDLDRVKALERSADSASSSPLRSDSASYLASAPAAAMLTADKKEATMPTASQDSFSTVSGTPQGSEKSGTRGKSGSSFMATVRTWLGGAQDKPARKTKGGKKSAAYRGLGIDAGTNAGKSPTSTVGKSESYSTLANGTPTRNPSTRRRSAHYQQISASRRGGPRSPHLGSISRRSSTGSSHHGNFDPPPNSFPQSMSRPGNIRRMSAGSITPTATVYGDYMNDMGGPPASSRPSRPSSSHSLAHSNAGPRSGLRGKAGSTGSASSAYRPGQASSTYSTGSGRRPPRPSHDGGTTVRRHRAYASSSGSPSRRNSFRHDSRPSSVKSRASSPGRAMTSLSEFGAEAEDDAGGSGARPSTRSTPRHSFDQRSISDVRSSDPVHAQHHHVMAQSIFVAHKSRSPYRPPSANPHLHGSVSRGPSQHLGKTGTSASDASSVTPSNLSGLPATGTGTWRHSWGRPPPCWAGPVDPPPIHEAAPSLGSAEGAGSKPKLRDVFANRDDDDWTDEEDEPMYSGGLGQTGSLSSMSARGGTATTSPYATRNFAALGSGSSTQGFGTDSASSRMASSYRGAAPFSSRYAGVRQVFQHHPAGSGQGESGFRSNPVSLSLGNEFAPKVLSATLHSPTKSPSGPGPLGSLGEISAAASSSNGAAGAAGAASGTKTESNPSASQSQQGGGGSRITASFHKPAQIIEEEEEDE